MTDFPLIVDLDNALLRTNLFLECLFAGVRHGPAHGWRLLGSGLLGRRGGLDMLEQLQLIDVTRLPYDRRIITLVEQERTRGQTV